MKLNWAFGILLTTTSLFASDYEITRFLAEDFRDYTFQELSSQIGNSQELLKSYRCNQSDEFDPFSAPLRWSLQQNSLRVKIRYSASGDEFLTNEFLTYKEGHFFDSKGSEVKIISDPFALKVRGALERLEKIEAGAKLLRHLEESYFPVTIWPGGNRFDPQTIEGKMWSGMRNAKAMVIFSTLKESAMSPLLTDIGSGGRVYWNPNLEIETIESDGIRRKQSTDISLAHELYHSFDSIRGLLDIGKVDGREYEFESVMEYRAVYFENLVRKELGVKLRKHYGDGTTIFGQDSINPPDLLDEFGETINIPSPCLKQSEDRFKVLTPDI